MVESNVHFQDAERTLTRVVDFDRIIRRTAEGVGEDALIIFTADHSYVLRLPHGRRDEDVLQHVHIENSHAAEEVLVAARGPGADTCPTLAFSTSRWRPTGGRLRWISHTGS